MHRHLMEDTVRWPVLPTSAHPPCTCLQHPWKEVDLVTVATMMGHRLLDITALYTRPSEEDMTNAVEKLALE